NHGPVVGIVASLCIIEEAVMNQIRLLLIAIVAVALGGFLGSVVYRNLQSKSDSAQPRVDVLVAANDLRVGSTIKDGDIKIVRFPADDLPANCYHLKSSVVGRSVILPIAKGEFFLPNKLAGENAGYGLSALIPPGMRAVSVLGVTDSVVPGTRVDVLLTRNRTGGGGAQTTTVLENVAVISSGLRLERNAAGHRRLLSKEVEFARRAAAATLQSYPREASTDQFAGKQRQNLVKKGA